MSSVVDPSPKCFDTYDDLASYLKETEIAQCTKYVRVRSIQDYTKTLEEPKFGESTDLA